MRFGIHSLLWPALFAVQCVSAFEFTHDDPTECGQVTVRWSGGTPPFRLLIIPPGGTLRNFSIPDSNYVGTSGTYSTEIPFRGGQLLSFSMSDATGVTAGGVTELVTVGGPADDATCNTTDPGAEFFYSLESPLVQCADYPFTNYGRATQPITVFGFVPGGPSFSTQAPPGDSFNWRANVPEGTPLLFYVTDALGRNGGVSPLTIVGPSSDVSCLVQSSASASSSSTASSPAPNGSQSRSSTASSRRPSATSGSENDDDQMGGEEKSSGGSKVGIIVGAAAGGFVFLGIFAFFAVFCLKRKKKQSALQDLKLDTDRLPGAITSPSNTYLLPSSYNGSNSNFAPSQSAAPYAQDSYSSNLSYTQSPSSGAGRQRLPASNPQAPQAAVRQEYNPYAPTNEMDAYGGYQESNSGAGGMAPYGANNNAAMGYPPYAAGAAAVAATSAYGYNQYDPYNQYQQGLQQQYQRPQQGYNQSSYTSSHTQGQLYATNADRPSSSSYSPKPKQTHTPFASGEKSGLPPSAPSQRVIIHQDIDETMDIPEELPPQYSESRAPIPGMPSSYPRGSANSRTPLVDRKG